MRFANVLSAGLSSLALMCAPVFAQGDLLPATGTYFIINTASGQAVQPAGPTPGQNVLLYDYNKGGMQKWVLTRKIDPVTKKPTNRYTIKLAGENDGLNLEPHPISDATAILGSNTSVYSMEASDAGVVVKSVARNGDAMYPIQSPPMNAEVHFGPSDGSAKFRWKFDPAE